MRAHLENYWPEPCAFCDGHGRLLAYAEYAHEQFRVKIEAPQCSVCSGKAYVLVLQPARACQHCSGTGKASQTRCLRCRGTGWMFVQNEANGSPETG